MPVSYAARVGQDFDPDPSKPVLETLFKQYETVLLMSLAISFGLDFLVKDHPGGDRDAIRNVRNSQATNKVKAVPRLEISGRNLPNFQGNLQAAGRSINSFKKENLSYNFGKWLNKSALQREQELRQLYFNPKLKQMRKESEMYHKLEERNGINADTIKGMDITVGSSYGAGVAEHHTRTRIPKSANVMVKAGVKVGIQQALGVIFLEMWIGIREEFLKFKEDDDFAPKDLLEAVGKGAQRGFQNAKKNYREIFSEFADGTKMVMVSDLVGALSNIFFKSAGDVIRIFRQSYVSLVEAVKVLFINPDNYVFGERMRAVIKILAIGASLAMGTAVSDAIGAVGFYESPVLGDIVPPFCGVFVSGIMSCTLLYFLDRSEIMNRLFRSLDKMHNIDTDVNYYRQQGDYFEKRAAELANIDLAQFKKETVFYRQMADSMDAAETEEELNEVLKKTMETANVLIPWEGWESFDSYMDNDKSAPLVFE